MIVLARALSRLVAIALMALLAVAGGAAAIFCIGSGRGTLALASLAADAHLPQLRSAVDSFLTQLTAAGPVAIVAALCGAGAVVLGGLLIAGAWVTPRPRRIVLEHTEDGTLGALRRPLARAVADRALMPAEIGRAHARAWSRRRRDGGRVRVTVHAVPGGARRPAGEAARAALKAAGDGSLLRVRVRAHGASRRDRRRASEELAA